MVFQDRSIKMAERMV